jgi:hypothetical protein
LRPRTGEPERRGEASVLLLSFICYCRRQATRSRECSGRSLCSPWPGARAVSSSCVSPIAIATARSRWCFAALFSPVLTCLPIWLGPTGQCLFHSSGLDRRRPPAGPSAAWDVCLQKPDQFVAKLCTVVLVHGFSGKTMSRNSNSSAKWTSPFRWRVRFFQLRKIYVSWKGCYESFYLNSINKTIYYLYVLCLTISLN